MKSSHWDILGRESSTRILHQNSIRNGRAWRKEREWRNFVIISKSYKFLKIKKTFPLAVCFMFNLYRRNFISIQIAYHQQVPPPWFAHLLWFTESVYLKADSCCWNGGWEMNFRDSLKIIAVQQQGWTKRKHFLLCLPHLTSFDL